MKQKFTWIEGELEPVTEAALVLKSPEGKYFTCGDQGGIPIYGPQDERADQLGLNLPEVRALLHVTSCPLLPTGAFYIRWSADAPSIADGQERIFAFVLLRQSVRTDQQSGWSEVGLSFCAYLSDLKRQPVPIEGPELRHLLRGLQAATPRVKAPPNEGIADQLLQIEYDLSQALRRPSEDEIAKGVRHAVWPIACGIIDLEK